MKQILIVDDNKNNRLFLSALLDYFSDEHPGVQFEISEAENGKEAVDLAASTKFDMILMDIMMPEMDGIEATRVIRDSDKNVMIIAVSAADDEARKKDILNSGAEDYIAKPVNADIFQTRLVNYLSLIEARSHKRFNKKAFNLYTQKIYNRQTTFLIDSEDALSEFWEYYLLTDHCKYDLLSDVVRTLSALGDLYIRLEIPTRIVAEESETELFLTIDESDQLQRELIDLTMSRNKSVTEFKQGDNRISFMLEKCVDEPVALLQPQTEAAPEPAPEPAAEDVELLKSSDAPHEVFDYMDSDDLDEIENYIGKLDSLLVLVGQSDMTDDEISEIFTYLERIGKTMSTYTETYSMGLSLVQLSADIAGHIDDFLANSTALGPMCSAFSRDLSKWAEMTFHEGSPSVDFLDDTVIANAQTIGSMLKMHDAGDGAGDDLDDIFDF